MLLRDTVRYLTTFKVPLLNCKSDCQSSFCFLLVILNTSGGKTRKGKAGQVASSLLCSRTGLENTPCYPYSRTMERFSADTLNMTIICSLLMGIVIDTKTVTSGSAPKALSSTFFVPLLHSKYIFRIRGT